MCRYLLSAFFFLLASCRAEVKQRQPSKEKQPSGKEAVVNAPAGGQEVVRTEPAWVVSGRYEASDTFYYPHVEEAYASRLLGTGVYHADEVDSATLQNPWLGLFTGAKGSYLAPAPILAKRVEDAVLDEEGQKTGWEITTAVKDSSVILLSGAKGLAKGAVETIKLPRRVLPGEEVAFSFRGRQYKLYATGKKKARGGETIYSDYRLFMQYDVNGEKQDQLLVSHPVLDEAMTQILFAGDLNRDGLPDLLLDTSWHYNALVPTLYLSRTGAENGLLEVEALHMSVGC